MKKIVNLITNRKYTFAISFLFVLAVLVLFIVNSANREITIKTVAKRDINASSNTSVMLKNGRILITGGSHKKVTHNKAVIFDPETYKFIKIPDMNVPRGGHTATLLKDGRVLITGGLKMINHSNTRYKPVYNHAQTAEIYDPEQNVFIKISDMTEPRFLHEAIMLNNGKILITGGSVNYKTIATAEIYDPQKNVFVKTGNMQKKRGAPSLTLLKDGRVLFIGGADDKSVEIYNPEAGKFLYIGETLEKRNNNNAFLLNSGKLLIAGTSAGLMSRADSGKYELFDLKIGSSIEYGHMIKNRKRSKSILLNDGRLFVYGGVFEENIVDSKNLHDGEIFNLETKESKLVKFRWNDWKIEFYKPYLLKNGDVALVGDYNVKIVSFIK